MRKLLLATILLVGVLPVTAQERYFPPKAFNDDVQLDQFVSGWYSSKLKILEEPSLLEMTGNRSPETYRFLWLRTFHNPVAVRLEFENDGTAILFAKVATGNGSFPDKNARLVQNLSRPIGREEREKFQRLLERADFWTLPRGDRHRGNDGAEWIVEGVKESKYQVVVRWSPLDGAIREIGMMLAFGLADLKIPKEDIY